MENTLQESREIRLSLQQIIGWILSIAMLCISAAYAVGSYQTELSVMKNDIQEGKEIAKQLNQSVLALTVEVKSLRTSLDYVNQKRTTTENR